MSINIPNISRPKGYAPFRTYTRYGTESHVEDYLKDALIRGEISAYESEYRLYIPTPLGKKQVFIDFVIKKDNKIGFIEVDGKQHYEYVPKFHKNGISDFIKQQNRDRIVNNFCAKYGTLLRIKTRDNQTDRYYKQVDSKLKKFINAL